MSLLKGTQDHVDASIASASLLISDQVGVANQRGWTAMVQELTKAREEMRRHVANWAWPYPAGGGGGVTRDGNPPFEYMIGSAAAGDGVRVRPRDVLGVGTTQVPHRLAFYISAHAGGGVTHTVRLVTSIGNYDTLNVNGTGWFGPGVDVFFAPGDDYLKLQVDRTDGGGGSNLTLNSVCCYEAIT